MVSRQVSSHLQKSSNWCVIFYDFISHFFEALFLLTIIIAKFCEVEEHWINKSSKKIIEVFKCNWTMVVFNFDYHEIVPSAYTQLITANTAPSFLYHYVSTKSLTYWHQPYQQIFQQLHWLWEPLVSCKPWLHVRCRAWECQFHILVDNMNYFALLS